MKTDTLNRWAAVVTVLVVAGCEEIGGIQTEGGRFIVRIGGQLLIIDDTSRGDEKRLLIARLEQWFSQTVVPWADDDVLYCSMMLPMRHIIPKDWHWSLDTPDDCIEGSDPSPTEAYIQCAEALAKVIGEQGDDQDTYTIIGTGEQQ